MKHFVRVAAMCVAAGTSVSALAQWVPNYQNYAIQRIGLFGAEHTGSAGFQFSSGGLRNMAGQVAGVSQRIARVNTINGQNSWVYSPTTNTTVQTGLTGAAHTGSAGCQTSAANFQNAAGQVAGFSYRFTGVNTIAGQNTWVYNPVTRATVQIGLVGSVYTSSVGQEFSSNDFQNASGQVAGYSERSTIESPNNGQNTWVYNPATNTTVKTGLTGAAHVSSVGKQVSRNNFQNDAGQVAGISFRFSGVLSYNGQNTWIYNPTTNTTVQTGLIGADYTGSAGYQSSNSGFQNAAGQVAGSSSRITGVDTNNGYDTWVYNPTTNTTVQTGLIGADYIGSAGFRSGGNSFQNDAGQVAGFSRRITGVNTNNGQHTWVYNPVTGTTVRTGLTGPAHTVSTGYQFSSNDFQNSVGQVAGFSRRAGSQNSQNTWVYNPTTNTTVQTGLAGAVYTGSAGFQSSSNSFQNAAGQVAGFSQRVTGVNTNNGQDTWAYNPTTNATVQTGLTGAVYTGSAGFQSSSNSFQRETGLVAGFSQRIAGVNTNNGQNTWAYNPTTNATVQTGLTGADYTGSAGFQFSSNYNLQSTAGQVVGLSQRIIGENTPNGQDVWYFDPTTNLTSAIIGSVRTSDSFAFSTPSILTEGGFLLGYYSYFAGGENPAVDRAFIFRPDIGLTDLGDLVSGGLTANGWNTLLRPQFASALNTFVGYGYINGQTEGQSVFVMTIPAPGAAALLGLGGLMASRRRRGT